MQAAQGGGGPMGNAGADEGEKGGLTPSQIGILQLNNLTFKLEPVLFFVFVLTCVF